MENRGWYLELLVDLSDGEVEVRGGVRGLDDFGSDCGSGKEETKERDAGTEGNHGCWELRIFWNTLGGQSRELSGVKSENWPLPSSMVEGFRQR